MIFNIRGNVMFKTGEEVRAACRKGEWTDQTSGLAPGFVQANLVIVPYDWAWDFMLFAQRNPKPCPLIETGEPGSPYTEFTAHNADIRSDLPKYRIYENGTLTGEAADIRDLWRDDYVFFLIGCSFSFEEALVSADIEVRHIKEGKNVPMYKTSVLCNDSGRFTSTPMVVSMRPFTPENAVKAIAVTREYPGVHGAPVHIGNPEQIGIRDLSKPDWGDPVTIRDGEIPLFWACGVTPQMAAMTAKIPLMITHAPGHMFVGDRKNNEYRI